MVMAQVISTSGAKTGRQPAVHMNPPVRLLSHDQVDSPAYENATEDSRDADQRSNQECWNSIDHEQKNNVQWGTDQGNVFCFSRTRVVLAMLHSVWSTRLMQQPTMVSIFKSIPPNQTDEQP